MAHILLLDDSEVAGRAMLGILSRGNHTCYVATTPAEAWRVLRDGVVFDLVFMELKLGGLANTAFLQRLRSDWFWKILPVVVYTYESDTKLVRRALGLRIQNYLIKPFSDEMIFREIEKAMKNPWRNLHFEDPKSFCALTDLTLAGLTDLRRQVMLSFENAAKVFPTWAEHRQNEEVFNGIRSLVAEAETAGVWAGVDFLRSLQEHAGNGNWSAFHGSAEFLDFASRLIFCQLNPSYTPDSVCSEEVRAAAREAAEKARWEGFAPGTNGPLLDSAALLKQVATLSGSPVMDTTAAAFQMLADGRANGMGQLMDLVAGDPGLSAQVLAAANRIQHDEMNVIDDVRSGATLLGELKLTALGKTLPIAEEKHLHNSPIPWSSFWMFQVAVGRVAQFVCSYLELDYLGGRAFTGGVLHDLGKLVLMKLHPFALPVLVRYARERKMPLADVERLYLGCTSREIGLKFAETHDLPAVYADVIRWVETPALATNNGELIAMVALARHVCLHANVGNSGEIPGTASSSFTRTPAWQVLEPRIFPSFDAKKFEVQAHAYCLTLRSELSGQRADRRPSHAQRAAELV